MWIEQSSMDSLRSVTVFITYCSLEEYMRMGAPIRMYTGMYTHTDNCAHAYTSAHTHTQKLMHALTSCTYRS